MTDPGSTAREIAADARVLLGRLNTAWSWVTMAREPGSAGPQVTRPTDLRAAVRAAEVWRIDRAAAVDAARAGRKVSGTLPSPVRLGVAQIRFRVVDELVNLTNRMWDGVQASGLVMLLRESNQRTYTRPCDWCTGHGAITLPEGWVWEWPTDPVPCPRCMGKGRVPTGDQCPACRQLGPCRCDRADIAAAIAVFTIDELLDDCDVELAADAEATLWDLVDLAEAAAGAGPDRRRLPGAECPVCGSRELIPEVSDHDPRRWAIYCQGPDCLCQGAGCPCGIGTPRRADRRHMWPAGTWDGPKGLAKRLGVDLPGTKPDPGPARAIRAARRESRRRQQATPPAAEPGQPPTGQGEP